MRQQRVSSRPGLLACEDRSLAAPCHTKRLLGRGDFQEAQHKMQALAAGSAITSPFVLDSFEQQLGRLRLVQAGSKEH